MVYYKPVNQFVFIVESQLENRSRKNSPPQKKNHLKNSSSKNPNTALLYYTPYLSSSILHKNSSMIRIVVGSQLKRLFRTFVLKKARYRTPANNVCYKR